MNRLALIVSLLMWLPIAGGCLSARHATPPSLNDTPTPASVDLDVRYQRISQLVGDDTYGPGGQVVLGVAYRALKEKHAAGEGLLVGLEDLWAHSLQEASRCSTSPRSCGDAPPPRKPPT
jgi:hypothetical protein